MVLQAVRLCSISYGVVPDQMKLARVILLYKADDKSVLTNYRPVSILPSFSTEIFRKNVYNRLTDHISKFNILYNSTVSGKITT